MSTVPMHAPVVSPSQPDELLEILVVHDDPVVLEGLRVLLRSEGVRVASTASGVREATTAVAEQGPAAALVGVAGDREAAFGLAHAISTAAPSCAVLLYAEEEREIDVVEALSRGAAGVVTRRTAASKLAAALRWVSGGGVWLEGDVAPKPTRTARTARLSRRELDVLGRMAQGRSTEQIAEMLGVTPHTVRTHARNLLKKVGAHTRAHAVAIAMHEGAIDVTP